MRLKNHPALTGTPPREGKKNKNNSTLTGTPPWEGKKNKNNSALAGTPPEVGKNTKSMGNPPGEGNWHVIGARFLFPSFGGVAGGA